MAKRISFIFILGLLACLLYTVSAYDALERRMLERLSEERMKNVTVTGLRVPDPQPAFQPSAGTPPPPEETAAPSAPEAEETMAEPPAPEQDSPEGAAEYVAGDGSTIKETTIRGGLSIKNETGYWVDAAQIISDGPGLSLPSGEPQILLIHTHSSEAYTQAGLDRYEPSDSNRTENTEFNVVRIGDELAAIFQQAGLVVIHDRGIYDYPSYTGSYTRSGQVISQYLKDYPSLRIVIDIHRDALGSDGVVYKTMAEEEGSCASQIMLLVGSDESGLQHPLWRENLALALYLQNTVNSVNPTLMRPVDLVPQRYNQHLSTGQLIMEVGSSGNTLQEALAAIRLFGNAAAPALLELVEAEAELEE